MNKFIPREKLGKKARRQLDRKMRVTWEFSPVTKRVESKKLYNRKKSHAEDRMHRGMGFFVAILCTDCKNLSIAPQS